MLAYYLLGYWLVGHVLRFFIVRNIPFSWVVIGFYATLAGFEAFFFSTFMASNSDLVAAGWYWLTTLAMIIASVFAVTHYFEEPLRTNLSKDPGLVPIWRPVRLGSCALEALLPSDVRGPIQRIKAQNQYMKVVTDKGEALLRMSLAQAQECLPDEAGLRIHRSIWLRRSEISDLVFRDGNPKVIDACGAEYPASRKMVDDIRSILARLA